MHRQYTTYVKQETKITKLRDVWIFMFYQSLMWMKWDPIKYYFYSTLIVVLSWPEDGRSWPKHVAKYHLIL